MTIIFSMSFMVRWSLKAWNRTCLSSSRDICCMSNCGWNHKRPVVKSQHGWAVSASLCTGQCSNPTVIYYGRISSDRKDRDVNLVRRWKMTRWASLYVNQVFTCSITLALAQAVVNNEKSTAHKLWINIHVDMPPSHLYCSGTKSILNRNTLI